MKLAYAVALTVLAVGPAYAADGIRINAVAPGNILFEGGTWQRMLAENKAGVEEMLAREVPLRRLGTPRDVSAACLFLLSDDASFVTGVDLVVDGGWMLALS